MPSLRHYNSSVLVIFDKQLHQFSTSKMKFSKAPELLKKAVTVFKIKAEVLHTKLLIMVSLRRRMAMFGTVSRGIREFVPSDVREKQARVEYGDKDLVLLKAQAASQEPAVATAVHGRDGMIVDLSEVDMFDEHDNSYPDWTHSLFNDDNCYDDEEDAHHNRDDDYGVLDDLGEPSVIDIIRSNREVEGLEFNMDEEIDEACDMFIRRFRKRMNSSF